MKVSKTFLGAAVLSLLSLAACKNMDYKKTKDGMLYQVLGDGKGEKLMPGNVVRAHITNRLADSVLNTTYGKGPNTFTIPASGPNLENARFFLDAHKGDSILILQPVDSILANMAKNPMARPDSFLLSNKGKSIKTYVKIVDVFKSEEAARSQQKQADEAAIESYLKNKSIQTKRSPKGTYIQTITPGNGQLPKAGQEVSLRYTGKLMNGQVFDSNNKPGDPVMPLQIGMGGTIPGFEDGIAQLSKGEKAVLYIPSALAYGAQAPPMIGPDQNLIFDIEIVDIKDKPATPATPPMGMPDTTVRKK